MVEIRGYTYYANEAKRLHSLSIAGETLMNSLNEYAKDQLPKIRMGLRMAVVLNTPNVSLLNYPRIEAAGPNYRTFDGSPLDQTIVIEKLRCQAELPGFDQANATVEEGLAAMYEELISKRNLQEDYKTSLDRLHREMMFIRQTFMKLTEESTE